MGRNDRRIGWGHRFYAFWANRSECHIVRGVPVAILLPTPEERAAVIAKMDDALHLIERYDPQRFRYLHRDVRLVWLFGSAGALGRWHDPTRILELKLSYVIDPRSQAAEVASILVHEGTARTSPAPGVRLRRVVSRPH
jgi:hypothetical protein